MATRPRSGCLDVNSCSAKELASLPGIDLKTAERVVRYRRTFGPFNNCEELMRIPGMTKTDCKLLAKHSRNRGGIPIAVPIVPMPRTSVKSIMDQVLCQGKSVNPAGVTGMKATYRGRQKSAPASGDRTKTADVATGLTRSGKRYRLPDNAVEICASLETDYMKAARLYKPHFNKPATPDSVRRSDTPKKNEKRDPSAGQSDVKLKLSKGDPQKSDVTVKKEEGNKTPTGTPAAITVETTPSGNNINFSCTIDKKFLKEPRSMSFLFNQNDIDVEHRGLGPNSLCTPSSCTPKTSLNTSLTSSSHSSTLSQENMYLFEKHNTPDSKQKKRRIAKWISSVNSERSSTQSDYKSSVSIYRNSRSTEASISTDSDRRLPKRPMINIPCVGLPTSSGKELSNETSTGPHDKYEKNKNRFDVSRLGFTAEKRNNANVALHRVRSSRSRSTHSDSSRKEILNSSSKLSKKNSDSKGPPEPQESSTKRRNTDVKVPHTGYEVSLKQRKYLKAHRHSPQNSKSEETEVCSVM